MLKEDFEKLLCNLRIRHTRKHRYLWQERKDSTGGNILMGFYYVDKTGHISMYCPCCRNHANDMLRSHCMINDVNFRGGIPYDS